MRTRREGRVTFHARPTCHDFFRGGNGVSGGGASLSGNSSGRRRRPRDEGTTTRTNNSDMGAVDKRESGGSLDGFQGKGGGAVSGPGTGRGAGVAQEGGGDGGNNDGRSGSSGDGGGSRSRRAVDRIAAVGFKSGECAVLDATATNSPSFLSVLNKGGAHCEGRVTAVRFVPGAGRHLFVAAFSTGDAYTFDTKLGKEAPMGAAAEKDSSATVGTSNGGGGGGSGGGSGSGGSAVGRSSQDSIGSSSGGSSWGKRGSNHGSSSSSSNGSAPAPPLPASFTGGGNAKSDGGSGSGGGGGGGAGGGKNGRGSSTRFGSGGPHRPSDRRDGFFVEINRVTGANPVSRWRVASDGREITDMAFAPCEVDGRRLVALSALDGVSQLVRQITARETRKSLVEK